MINQVQKMILEPNILKSRNDKVISQNGSGQSRPQVILQVGIEGSMISNFPDVSVDKAEPLAATVTKLDTLFTLVMPGQQIMIP